MEAEVEMHLRLPAEERKRGRRGFFRGWRFLRGRRWREDRNRKISWNQTGW